MRKEKYYDLEMQVIHFESEDIITTSKEIHEGIHEGNQNTGSDNGGEYECEEDFG